MELFWIALGTMFVIGFLSQWGVRQLVGGPWLRETHATWKPWAEAEGLQFEAGAAPEQTRIHGFWKGAGVQITLESDHQGYYNTRVEVVGDESLGGVIDIGRRDLDELEAPSAAAQQRVTSAGLDPDWRIRGASPALALHIGTAPAVVHVLQQNPALRVEGGTVVLRCKGSDVALIQRGVEQSRALVFAMQEAQHQFFEQLAQRTGLTMRASDQHPLGQLEGEVEGVRVVVRPARSGSAMHLLATIPHPVLPSLQVVSRDAAVVGELRLNDPILDGTVSVTALGDASVARALLSRDGTREDLLSVVKGHPGGKVDGEHVYLPIPAVSLEGVLQAVSDAVALARSLSDATQRPPEDGERAAQAARQTVTS